MELVTEQMKKQFSPVAKVLRSVQRAFFSPLGLALAAFVLLVGVVGVSHISQRASETEQAVLHDGRVGISYVAEAADALQAQDFDAAAAAFNSAAERFLAAEKEVSALSKGVDDVLIYLPFTGSVTSKTELLEAGSDLALAGKYLSRAGKPFQSTSDILQPLKEGIEQEYIEGITFSEAISIASQNIVLADIKLQEAELHLSRVHVTQLPEEVRGQVSILKEILPVATTLVKTTVEQSDLLLSFLGHDRRKTYLFLFQNDRELRPTGGFIGTIGFITLDEGRIEEMKFEGTYHLDGQLKEIYNLPEPLRLITDRAYSRDMNWFLDFPTSAERVAWYLDKSGAPTVDGVIALNASIMEDLLAISGPVTIEEYGLTVDADTFYDVTQQQVEFDYDKEQNRPKQFVADMIPVLLKQTFENGENWSSLVELISSSLDEKDVLVWFADKDLEKRVDMLGYSGAVSHASRDYLAVVATNLGGGKTDHVVHQDIAHQVEIKQDGSVIDTVTITRSHVGDPDDEWEGFKNASYVRVYVPLGSELIEADGFDPEYWGRLSEKNADALDDPVLSEIERTTRIHEPTKTRIQEESGKTTFGNWMGTEAGQQNVVRLKYKLPFSVDTRVGGDISAYSLMIQRQPGSRNVTFSSKVLYPASLRATWQYVTDGLLSGDGHVRSFSAPLDRDRTYAIVFE